MLNNLPCHDGGKERKKERKKKKRNKKEKVFRISL